MSYNLWRDYDRWMREATSVSRALPSASTREMVASITPAIRAHESLRRSSANAAGLAIADAVGPVAGVSRSVRDVAGAAVRSRRLEAQARTAPVRTWALDNFGAAGLADRRQAEEHVQRADEAMRHAGVTLITGRVYATGRTLTASHRAALKNAERELRDAQALRRFDTSANVRISTKLRAIDEALAHDDLQRRLDEITRVRRTALTAPSRSLAATVAELVGQPVSRQLKPTLADSAYASRFRGPQFQGATFAAARSLRALAALYEPMKPAMFASTRAPLFDWPDHTLVGLRSPHARRSGRHVSVHGLDVEGVDFIRPAELIESDSEVDYDEATMKAIFTAVMWLHATQLDHATLLRRNAAERDDSIVVAQPGDVASAVGLATPDDARARRRILDDVLWPMHAYAAVHNELTADERRDLRQRRRAIAAATFTAFVATATPITADSSLVLLAILPVWAGPWVLLHNYYETLAANCLSHGLDDLVPPELNDRG